MTGTDTGAYGELLAFLRETAALAQITSILHWDQETCMPPRGAAARAEECAALEGVLHARRSDPRLDGWLAAIDESALDPVARVNVAETRRQLQRTRRTPAALATELARVTSNAHGIWVKAREQRRFADFAPTLTRIVELKREQARCLSDDGELYSALIDEFEPGAREPELAAVLGRLRTRLTALVQRLCAGRAPTPDPLRGKYEQAAQLELARLVATAMGYDFSAGRIDLAVHPFSSGAGGDVRITTRVDADQPIGCLYSTIHEVGHALYEQGIAPELELTPAGESASMGVHESQSRLWENQIGRSRAFATWLHPQLARAFSAAYSLRSPDELYRALNRVAPSFIRTESDEVTYNLHIALRFDLERALIRGDLQVADAETAWNERFAADFGMQVPDASAGVLQDVHWSAGIFGYFPTYSLGNIYAAEIHQALRAELTDLDDQVARGDLRPVREWLRQRVHRHGRLYPPEELVSRVSGRPPTEDSLLRYLEGKFGEPGS